MRYTIVPAVLSYCCPESSVGETARTRRRVRFSQHSGCRFRHQQGGQAASPPRPRGPHRHRVRPAANDRPRRGWRPEPGQEACAGTGQCFCCFELASLRVLAVAAAVARSPGRTAHSPPPPAAACGCWHRVCSGGVGHWGEAAGDVSDRVTPPSRLRFFFLVGCVRREAVRRRC